MAGRRGWGEDSIYFGHWGECHDPDSPRPCPGRWRGVVSLKAGPDGKRRRKKVSGRNKTEVRAKLAELHDELNDGSSARRCRVSGWGGRRRSRAPAVRPFAG